VADQVTPGDRLPKPGIVDVLPVETVEPMMARHEEELRAMRGELEVALREAEAAEERLNRHPAAVVFDDAFETEVLAQVARSVATVQQDASQASAPSLVGSTPPAPVGSPGDTTTAGATPAPVPATTVVNPAFEPPRRPSAASPTDRPRTVVVDRSAPRTVVVDRGRASSAVSPPSTTPSPPRNPSTSVSAADPGAEQFITAQAEGGAQGEADRKASVRQRGGARRTRNGHTSRLPARLLIQAGVIMVIVALLLLKLG